MSKNLQTNAKKDAAHCEHIAQFQIDAIEEIWEMAFCEYETRTEEAKQGAHWDIEHDNRQLDIVKEWMKERKGDPKW